MKIQPAAAIEWFASQDKPAGFFAGRWLESALDFHEKENTKRKREKHNGKEVGEMCGPADSFFWGNMGWHTRLASRLERLPSPFSSSLTAEQKTTSYQAWTTGPQTCFAEVDERAPPHFWG